MKWPIIFGMFGLLAGNACFAHTHLRTVNESSRSPRPGYSVTVAAPTGPIRVALPIDITITVTNIGTHDIWWQAEAGDTAYKAFNVLLTKNGREVGTTFLQRKLTGRLRDSDPPGVVGGSSIVSAVAPGKSFMLTINLQRLYKITEPGLYTLQVSRYDEVTKTHVHSNALNLKIEQ